MKKMFLALGLLFPLAAFGRQAIRLDGGFFVENQLVTEQSVVLDESNIVNIVYRQSVAVVIKADPSEDGQEVTLTVEAAHADEQGNIYSLGNKSATVAWGQQASFTSDYAPARIDIIPTLEEVADEEAPQELGAQEA